LTETCKVNNPKASGRQKVLPVTCDVEYLLPVEPKVVFTCKTSGKRKQTALDLAQKNNVTINDIEAGKKQAAVAAACNYCCD